MLSRILLQRIKKHPVLKDRVLALLKRMYASLVDYPLASQPASYIYPLFVDYPVNPQPRYGYGKPPHARLYELIDRRRESYKHLLALLLQYKDSLAQIAKVQTDPCSPKPAWINGWLPGLDAVALYGLLCLNNPHRYFEIGSGNSTKFARQAIQDYRLRTEITSFDPHPRAEIDAICDRAFRQPLEQVDLQVFDELEAGDIVFVDHSHRVFMNSDATVMFLDVLPRLKPGVLVEFHDVLLLFDYPIAWQYWYYSEQYVLAAYLLAEGRKFDILLPNSFVSSDPELRRILAPLWEDPRMQGVETHGASFWIQILG
ncbi:MAG: class I SAM-dependent methyltransferase [Candidatus Binatia bacterium]|nr:class I SAM-dependent methyltransferase [Candidatus Binatia bacterium]